MLYGLEIKIEYWGILKDEINKRYPELEEYLGKKIFKTERLRREYINKFEYLVNGKYSCGYDCDNFIELTDYGTFSILMKVKTWEEQWAEIKMR